MLCLALANYAALQKFFLETNGKLSWHNTTNWLNSTDYCTFYGVSCDANREVIGLQLRANGLTGKISEALEDLKSLRYLDLSNSTFETKLKQLCKVPSLEVVAIENANVNFEIPDCLCEMPNLRILDLTNNRITGPIPSCLKLETLHVSCNQLNGAFSYQLNNLTELSYGCNDVLEVDWKQFKGVLSGDNDCKCVSGNNCEGIWQGPCGAYVRDDLLDEYLSNLEQGGQEAAPAE